MDIVKNDYFISFVITLALCFAQLASNTHVLSHYSAPDMAASHTESGHDHTDHLELHAVFQLDGEQESEIVDCGIYHLVAGSSCLPSLTSCGITADFQCVLAAVVPSLLIAANIFESPHIRGPPQYS